MSSTILFVRLIRGETLRQGRRCCMVTSSRSRSFSMHNEEVTRLQDVLSPSFHIVLQKPIIEYQRDDVRKGLPRSQIGRIPGIYTSRTSIIHFDCILLVCMCFQKTQKFWVTYNWETMMTTSRPRSTSITHRGTRNPPTRTTESSTC